MKQRILGCLLILLLLLTAGCSRSAEQPVSQGSATAVTQKTDGTVTVTVGSTAEAVTIPSAEESGSPSQFAGTSLSPTTSETAVPTSGAAPTTTVPTTASSTAPTVDPRHVTITLSIDCRRAVEQGNRVAQAVAPDGVLLAETRLTLDRDATAYDALKASGLVIGARTGAFGAYVYAIQSLAEKACGGESGWLYQVNGEIMSTGSSSYRLQDGDIVRWVYTCDGGKDV